MKKLFVLCLSAVLVLSALSGCRDEIEKPAESAQPQVTETVNYPVELTSSELSDFQTAFRAADNYGFLLCTYDDVKDVDLLQVFYTGAGMSNPENSEEIANKYMASIGETEMYTDYTILTTQQINDFLTVKTGYNLSNMKTSLGWDYVDAYDAYINFHGDTNYINVTCTVGRAVSEDLFEIEYAFDGLWCDSKGNSVTGGTVTVKNTGDKMQFVSNSLH